MVKEKELLEKIEELQEKVEKQEQELERLKSDNRKELEDQISRRGFLKKLGAGAIGIGALSLTPTSALNIRSSGLSFYGGSGSGIDFDVDNSGNVSVYGDISDGGTTIWDSSNTWIPTSVLENSSVTVNAGNQLTGGGTVGLGSSITIDLNEGSGSGLDADTVDGKEASDLSGGSTALLEGPAFFYTTASNFSTYTTQYRPQNSGSRYLFGYTDTGGGASGTIKIKKNGNTKTSTTFGRMGTNIYLTPNDTVTFWVYGGGGVGDHFDGFFGPELY